jgi:small subunit ribosomal protein S6
MDTLTRHYETTFIINATLDDAQTEAVIARVQDILVKNEGSVTAVEKWGRKRLAFPIQKKNNGFYVVLLFSAKGDAVAKLERHYQLDENIMRFLTVQLDAKALKSRRSVARIEEEPAAAPVLPELPLGEAAEPQTVAAVEQVS